MAITALSGQRWQGSSTADPVTTKFLKLNSNSASNYRVSLDLQDKGGETVEDTWVIRFTRTITGGGASGGDDIGTHISYAMSNNDYSTGGTTGSQSVLGFKQGIGDGGAIAGSSTTMFPAPSNWGFANSGGADFTTVPNTYYFEIIRSGASGTDTLTAKVYTTSDYSGTPYGTASKDASSATVRYFSVANYNNGATTGSIEAEIKDFKFWNDTNSTSGTPTYTATFDSGEWGENNNAKIGVSSTTTYTDEKTTVTDVPTGSEFQETDTRKFYQMGTKTVSGTELRAYWKYDETSGTTFTNDAGNVTGNNSVGAGANLTLSGVTLNQSGSPSNLGVNASWDGSNDYAQQQSGNEGDFNFLHNGSDWSICFWAIINNRSPFANQEIIDNHGGSGTANGIDVRTRDNETIKIVAYGGGTKFIDVQPANDYIPDFTNFHYYCMTWDNSEKQVSWYRDGALFQQQTEGNGGGSGSATGELTIGGYWNDETGGSFDGNLCEMAIFARVLSSAEISTLYQNGDGFQLDTGLKVWKERGTAI